MNTTLQLKISIIIKLLGVMVLTAEFDKTFWPVIGKQLVETLNYSYIHGELSTSQKQATITLTEKKRQR